MRLDLKGRSQNFTEIREREGYRSSIDVKHRNVDHRQHRSLLLPLEDVWLMTCTESVLASGSCEEKDSPANANPNECDVRWRIARARGT
jgi:hypothetical protein